MFASLFALISVAVLFAVVHYDRYIRTKWEALGNGLWMQRRVSKNNAHFIFRTSGEPDATSIVPALWEIKKPFSAKPKYITQHEQQLRSWWEPLSKKYYALSTNPKAIKAIRFSPTLGIYAVMDTARKTKRVPEEHAICAMLQEALQTWKPRRFDVDSSYPIRQSMLNRWHWLAGAVMAAVFHGLFEYRYIDFLSDRYYIVLGVSMAITIAAALVFWFAPKMEGSAHRTNALTQMGVAAALSMGLTLPYALVWTNMLRTQTVCDMPVPVTEWYSRPGKTRTYHAVLDLRQCSVAVPDRASIRVSNTQYQRGTQMHVQVSKGLLGRYYLTHR